jgi:hypothetical protein
MNYSAKRTVMNLILDGRPQDAKRVLVLGCRTKPEVMAYRVGTIVGALTDPDGFRNKPDKAKAFLDLFKPE